MINRFRILNLFFLLFLFCKISYAQLNSDNWETVSLDMSSIYSEVPLKTEFFSKDSVFLLNTAGFFLSADGGNTFSKTQITGNELSFDFASREIGYMVGISGLLKKTTNSGISWFDLPLLIPNSLRAVCFNNDKKGIVVGDNGTIFRTADGGVNWKSISSGTSESLWAVKWISDKVVLISGNNCTMLRSIDGGLNFSPVSVPVAGNIYNLDFYNAQFNFLGDSSSVSLYDQSYILASGSLQTLLRSTDMGLTWTDVAPFEPNLAYKKTFSEISVADGKFAFAYGWFFYSGKKMKSLLKSIDGGINWEVLSLPDSLVPESFDFYNRYNLLGCAEKTGNLSALKYRFKNKEIKVLTPGMPDFVFSNKQKIPITWVSNNVTDVRLYCTTDGGSSLSFIADVPAADNYYEWETYDKPSANYRIIIKDKNDESLSASSDYPFTVRSEFWQFYSNGFAAATLRASAFPSVDVAYAAGEKGFFSKSIDSGKTFTAMQFPDTNDIYSLSFYDEANGIAAGTNGLFYKTANGGNSWEPIHYFEAKSFRKVLYLSPIKIIALPHNFNGFYISNNGGATWDQVETSGVINDVCYKDSTGFAVGENGLILKSSGNFFNWQPVLTGVTANFVSVSFFDRNIGYIATSHSVVLSTTNGGESWNLNNTGIDKGILQVEAVSSKTAFLLLNDVDIASSDDQGKSWQLQEFRYDNLFPCYYYSMSFSPILNNKRGLYALAVGKLGTVIRKSYGVPEHFLRFTSQPGNYDRFLNYNIEVIKIKWRGAGVKTVDVAVRNIFTNQRTALTEWKELRNEEFRFNLDPKKFDYGKYKIEITSTDDENLLAVSDSVINIIGRLVGTIGNSLDRRKVGSLSFPDENNGAIFIYKPNAEQGYPMQSEVYSYHYDPNVYNSWYQQFFSWKLSREEAQRSKVYSLDSLNIFYYIKNLTNSDTLWATTDGGNSWNARSSFIVSPTSYEFNHLKWFWKNASLGLINIDGIKKTVDGGFTWTNAVFPNTSAPPSIVDMMLIDDHTSPSFGLARSVDGGVYFTNDNGDTWNFAYQDISERTLSFDAIDRYKLYAVTFGNDLKWHLRKSENGGALWNTISIIEPITTNIDSQDCQISFVTDSVGMVIGKENKLFLTEDGGINWRNVEMPPDTNNRIFPFGLLSEKLNGHIAATTLDSFLGTDLVLIFKPFNKTLTDVEEIKGDILPTEYSLSQNYPNPFNPNTVIRYQLSVAGKVVLKVYDILGKEVAILVNGEQQFGTYSVNFDASHLSSGIYFYALKAGSFIQTKKMILLQ